MKSGIILMIFSIGLFLFGCKNNGESTHIKTFPNAGNYPLLTISSLKDSVSVPDTLNVRAYVVNKSICPRNMYCYLPDGIFISNIAKQDTSAYQPFLALTDPNEFSKGIPYLMSVKVIETGVIDSRTGNKVRRIDLLGYNIVN